MWTALISPVASLVGDWLNNKREESKAKHEAKIKHIQNTADWEVTQADASRNSLKDEWLTLLFSLPLIGAFTGFEKEIEEGFRVLNGMPDYYKAFLGAAVAASFGIKSLAKWGK